MLDPLALPLCTPAARTALAATFVTLCQYWAAGRTSVEAERREVVGYVIMAL